MKTITVRITKNYGNEAIYPVCKDAQILLDMTSRQTFKRADIARIKELGFTVNVETPTL